MFRPGPLRSLQPAAEPRTTAWHRRRVRSDISEAANRQSSRMPLTVSVEPGFLGHQLVVERHLQQARLRRLSSEKDSGNRQHDGYRYDVGPGYDDFLRVWISRDPLQ